MSFVGVPPEKGHAAEIGHSVSESRVAICMATYNGGRFVAQQIDSILHQTYSDWVLFVRDDGSTDDTCEVVDSYVSKYPGKIVRIIDDDELHDCSLNFLAALRFASLNPSFDFFMFCDQDDVWNDDKVELEVSEARRLRDGGKENPILVITDCSVTDEELRVTVPRLGPTRPFDPAQITLAQCIVNNVGQGATMLMNRSLAAELLSSKLDTQQWMYDWWAMMLALCLGRVVYLDRPTMKYRQHNANVSGAGNYHRSVADSIRHILREPAILTGWVDRLVSDEKAYAARAVSLLAYLGGRISDPDRAMLKEVARINESGALRRIRLVSQRQMWRQNTFYEKMYQFWSIVLAKRTVG